MVRRGAESASRAAVQMALAAAALVAGLVALGLLCMTSAPRRAIGPESLGGDAKPGIPAPLQTPDGASPREQARVSALDARAQPAPAPESLTLVVRVLESDAEASAEPRALTRVRIARHDGALLGAAGAERKTDLLGEVEWDGLDAGSYWVVLPGLAQRSVELVGTRTETVFVLSHSTTVRGIVLSTSGAPIAGASLWLSEYNNSTRGSVVTESDATGAFEFETQLLASRVVGALAEGFAPSVLEPLEPIDGLRPEELRLELVLEPGGRIVAGRVESTEGAPLAEAVVRLRHFGTTPTSRGDSLPARRYRFFPSREFRTDADGAFRFTGVAAVGFEIWATCEGWGQATASTERGIVDSSAIVFKLEPQARIEGRVVDAGGAPIPAVDVGVGRREAPGGRWVQTDNLGRFVLDGLSSGEHRVRHWKPGYAAAESVYTLSVGQHFVAPETRLETRAGRRVRGVVEPPVPWAGGTWGIRLEHDGETALTVARDGVFEVWPWAADEAEVTVLYDMGQDYVALRTYVAPLADRRVLLEVPADRLHSTLVKGRVLAAEGRAPTRYHVAASPRGSRFLTTTTTTLDEGSFALRLPARGEWELVIEGPGGELLHARVLPPLIGEVLDLGELLLEAPGWLRIELGEGGAVPSTRFNLAGAAGQILGNTPSTAGRVLELPPGEYQVVEALAGTTLRSIPVEIRAGSTTTVMLGCGVPSRSRLHVVLPANVEASAWLELREAGGGVLYSGTASTLGARGGSWSASCPPGTYRLRITVGMEELVDQRVSVGDARITTLDLSEY